MDVYSCDIPRMFFGLFRSLLEEATVSRSAGVPIGCVENQLPKVSSVLSPSVVSENEGRFPINNPTLGKIIYPIST